MKFIYPAVFRKDQSGKYHAHFPDLECCTAAGDTLDDAIDNANDAAYNWISSLCIRCRRYGSAGR